MQDRSKAYREAGVDTRAADNFIARIRKMVSSTHTSGVIGEIGGFGGLFKPDVRSLDEPVLVASTDGVGTKLKLAFAYGVHDTVGIDLVAMSVNDILVLGAKPLFFLDYFATGKLEEETAVAVLSGITAGCKEAGCALLGGETAEMPDFYPAGEYDLSGFCVGIVGNDKIVDGHGVSVGDAVVGLASSGLHSNGFSLVRRIVDATGLAGADRPEALGGRTLAETLLTPTRIYVRPIRSLLRDLEPKGMAHITGGGFYDNIPRVLPKGVAARIAFGSWDMPPVFTWLRETGRLSWPEMLQVFNCGIGYVLVVDQEVAEDVVSRLQGMGQPAWVIGRIEQHADDEGPDRVLIDFPEGVR